MNHGTQFRFSDKYCLLLKSSFACTKSSITVLQSVNTGKKLMWSDFVGFE